MELLVEKYKQQGDLENTYAPLRNVKNEDGEIVDFDTTELNVDMNNPLNIECQPSYDGTVNLIINDDKNPPRIINTRFSKNENNTYKIITRNQREQTNLYKEGKIDAQTRLFRNVNKFPKIDFIRMTNSGQLAGGNYVFYIKLADGDYNTTDIVSESGIVSVFKGDCSRISSISGTILHEKTDKAITLKISQIDTSFSKMYIYYSRDYCDMNGIKMSSVYMINIPYDISGDTMQITINGFEDAKEISIEELNIQYNITTAAKTTAQVQSMLFMGNIQGSLFNLNELQNASYFIKVTLRQNSGDVGFVNPDTYSDSSDRNEYYNPENIYYRLGYWPDEMYRLGVVYIMNDDSLSPVFNLRGCSFESKNSCNISSNDDVFKDRNSGEIKYLPKEDFLIDGNYLDNTLGVFKLPNNISVIDSNSVKPLYFEIQIPEDVRGFLKEEHKVKGFFFVRQKRIITTICQGMAIGVDNNAHIPIIPYKGKYIAESFVNSSKKLDGSFESHIIKANSSQGSGILCPEANMIPQIKSVLDSDEFVLHKKNSGSIEKSNKTERRYYNHQSSYNADSYLKTKLSYVMQNMSARAINNFIYSTKAGSGEEASQIDFLSQRSLNKDNTNLVRGLYVSYLGSPSSLDGGSVYDIKIPEYSEAMLKNYFSIRGNNNMEYFAISDRYLIDYSDSIDVYRGDCFTTTVTMRINRNFIDSNVPTNDEIVDVNTWRDNYEGYDKMLSTSKDGDDSKTWLDINLSDLNTVKLGMWVTFKCLSSYNLGLRSEDKSHVDEYALMGNPRTFYPFSDVSTKASYKTEESWLLNSGYGSTVGHRRNYIAKSVPYIREDFNNRVMFSNVQVDGSFKNSYRIFQGLDYADIDNQYGYITKLLPWGANLLAVFEHGIGILPINEKALIQSNSNQSVHMYGAGVMQNQVSVISPDFGSTWQESIIKTSIGVYGVDTYAKKIWKYSDGKGLEMISDTRVQKWLNDNINLGEKDKYPTIAIKNVKTHYNNFKGDIMFTFYNKETCWNLCYNERLNNWATRYSWTPLYSENINNVFYSTNREQAVLMGNIYRQMNKETLVYFDDVRYTDNNETKYRNPYWFENDDNRFERKVNFSNIIGEVRNKKFSYSYKIYNEDTYEETLHTWTDISISNDDIISIGTGNDNPEYIKVHISFTVNGKDYSEDLYMVEKQNNSSSCHYLQNGIYVHGRAGVFDEMDYTNLKESDNIQPSVWYDKQEPFEFEFVVNSSPGMHKIFDNLVIISNNVKPNEIQYEIIGDSYYGLDKKNLYWDLSANKKRSTQSYDGKTMYESDPSSILGYKCEVIKDDNLNKYKYRVTKKCLDMKDERRRIGNIQYREDSWYTVLEPVKYEEMVLGKRKIKEMKPRDVAIKIRIKYTGTDLVIVSALKTILTQSYA